MKSALRGVYAPVLTPFDGDLKPATSRFIKHCKWLRKQGAKLAIFGTNSEAASLSVAERLQLTDALLAAGVSPDSLMPGTGACALSEAVELTKHAVAAGAPGVLVLPPFYFKGVSDEGVFAYYSELIERVGSDALGVYLYHIPQLTQVPITMGLIERLLKRYPRTVLGAKDSSGDWENSKAMIEQFSPGGFSVFPASESLLSKALAIGGAGCISATVNVNPSAIVSLYEGWQGHEGGALQASADVVRKIFQAVPMIPAMKRVVAEYSADAEWASVRPPLVPLDQDHAAALLAALREARFDMPAYPREQRLAQ